MEEKPAKSVFYHFRFKFLAITTLAVLMYIILTGASELDPFAESVQFKLMGPFFVGSGIFFLLFKYFPIKCPHCHKVLPTKKDWTCEHCGKTQGKARFLNDKCRHCRQMQATSSCEHCRKTFML